MLAVLRVIALDHTDSAEGLGQPAGDLRVDLAALAEDGPDGTKRLAQAGAKDSQESEGDSGHDRTDAHENDERYDRRQQAADKIDQTGADEVTNAFHVAHDARHQHSRLVGIVVRDGEPPNVLLHPASQFGNESLRRFRQSLGQRKRGQSLDDGGGEHHSHERVEQVQVPFSDHVVYQILGGGGQYQARDAVDHHQQQPQCQQRPARTHEGPDFGKSFEDWSFWLVGFG